MEPSIRSLSAGSRREKTSASMEINNSSGAWGNCPRTAWLPTMTNSDAPVMPAAARMICSSCCRCMTKAGFDFPDFRWREHAGEGRILAQPLGVLRFRAKQSANLLNRTGEDLLPFGIAAQQRRSGGVSERPAREVGPGKINDLRLPTQPFGHTPGQFQAHLISFRVIHAAKFSVRKTSALIYYGRFLPWRQVWWQTEDDRVEPDSRSQAGDG